MSLYPRMRIRTPQNFGEALVERLAEEGTITRAEITKLGLSHFLNYYQAHQVAAALASDGVLQRKAYGAYELTPPYKTRMKVKQW